MTAPDISGSRELSREVPSRGRKLGPLAQSQEITGLKISTESLNRKIELRSKGQLPLVLPSFDKRGAGRFGVPDKRLNRIMN